MNNFMAFFEWRKDTQSLYYHNVERTILANGPYNGFKTICYYEDGLYHNENGPACIEWFDTDKTKLPYSISFYYKGKKVYDDFRKFHFQNFRKNEIPDKLLKSIVKYELMGPEKVLLVLSLSGV
jgi:hypothetical protein